MIVPSEYLSHCLSVCLSVCLMIHFVITRLLKLLSAHN